MANEVHGWVWLAERHLPPAIAERFHGVLGIDNEEMMAFTAHDEGEREGGLTGGEFCGVHFGSGFQLSGGILMGVTSLE